MNVDLTLAPYVALMTCVTALVQIGLFNIKEPLTKPQRRKLVTLTTLVVLITLAISATLIWSPK